MSTLYAVSVPCPLGELEGNCGSRVAESGVGVSSYHVNVRSEDLDQFNIVTRGGSVSICVIGNVFCRKMMQPVAHADLEMALARALEPLDVLVREFWGRYVAIQVGGHYDDVVFLRDPSGLLPCYWSIWDGVLRIASDAAALEEAGASRGDISWPAVHEHLCYPAKRSARTCFENVQELLPGVSQAVSATEMHSKLRWQPGDGAWCTGLSIEDLEAQVRRQVQNCVGAWAKRFPRPLLALSGGLDSSIIAACLRAPEREVACLTLVSGAGRGDERRYAASVANKLGLKLQVGVVDVGAVDFGHSTAARKPRPVARAFTQAIDAAAVEFADLYGVDAHFNGGGGDNVFGYLHSSLPAADCLAEKGPGREYLATIGSLATITGCNGWTIASRSVRHALWSKRAYREPFLCELLAVRPACPTSPSHPWLLATEAARPGQRQHIAAVLQGVHFTEYLNAADTRPTIYPLLSQPLVELCLGISSWLWCQRGRDRSLARAAFRDVLPAEILDRRVKGSFEGFVTAGFFRHIDRIRSLVLDGELARRGIIDLEACQNAFERPDRLASGTIGRLLQFADTEAWLAAADKAV